MTAIQRNNVQMSNGRGVYISIAQNVGVIKITRGVHCGLSLYTPQVKILDTAISSALVAEVTAKKTRMRMAAVPD